MYSLVGLQKRRLTWVMRGAAHLSQAAPTRRADTNAENPILCGGCRGKLAGGSGDSAAGSCQVRMKAFGTPMWLTERRRSERRADRRTVGCNDGWCAGILLPVLTCSPAGWYVGLFIQVEQTSTNQCILLIYSPNNRVSSANKKSSLWGF